MMKRIALTIAICAAFAAHAGDYYAPSIYPAYRANLSVTGPFTDRIAFNVQADGIVAFLVMGQHYYTGSQRFHNGASIFGVIDSVQLQDDYGTVIADWPSSVPLPAGAYILVVDGRGIGTAGAGAYSAVIQGPAQIGAPDGSMSEAELDMLLSAAYGDGVANQLAGGH